MDNQEPDDNVQLRVEDLHTPTPPPESQSASHFLVSMQRPSQRVVRVLMAISLVVLVVMVVLAGDPALRDSAIHLAQRFVPTPSPTLTPDATHFYLLPTPPGVEIQADGHPLSRLPLPGDSHPLILTRGRHVIVWDSTWFPFQRQECVVWVPLRSSRDACPLELEALPLGPRGQTQLSGRVITLHPSLATLAPNQTQALTTAIQTALTTTVFTTTIQVGEHYTLGTAHPPSSSIVTATTPLHATLRFVPGSGTDAFLPEPCPISSSISCRFPHQDCSQICTMSTSSSSAGSVGGPVTWIAGIGVNTTWTYTTPSGRVIGAGGPDPVGRHLVMLRISWDKTTAMWHVAPLFGHIAALAATDAAACDTALVQLGATTWSFMITDPPPGARPAVASAASPAEGCVVVVVNYGTSAPVFLARFDVLLTVNDAARNPLDHLPVASASEQHLAQQLMIQLHL